MNGQVLYIDIAKSYISSEISKIQSLRYNTKDQYIKKTCKALEQKLREYLKADIQDQYDLNEIRQKVDWISESVNLLSDAMHESALWVLPLINQCYSICGIPLNNRKILIINNKDTSSFEVHVDFPLLKQLGVEDNDNHTDIFKIPHETKFDLASISLIGHEVGHVLFKLKADIKDLATRIITKLIQKRGADPQLTLPFQGDYIKRFSSHIQEYFCDSVGRALFSISFDFSLLKFLGGHRNKRVLSSETHPPLYKRLDHSYTEILAFDAKSKDHSQLNKCLEGITNYFNEQWTKNGNTFKPIDKVVLTKDKEKTDEAINSLIEEIATDLFVDLGLAKLPKFDLSKCWDLIVPEFDNLRPPFESVGSKNSDTISPIEAQIIATLYFYGKHYQSSNKFFLESEKELKDDIVREKLVEHLIYAISLYDFVKAVREDADHDKLNSSTIWTLRDRGSGATPFVVIPTIDPNRQYGANSVDLRLGPHFIISKLTQHTHITTNPEEKEDDIDVEYFYDRHYVPVSGNFTIHPQSFVLASTLEYVNIPTDFYALVLGRSTWGRLGLNIATATAIGPGFKGCITLELRNLSETPLTLKVGTRICQICLIPNPIEKVPKGYFIKDSKYICPTTAEIPKILADPDWSMFKKFKDYGLGVNGY